MLHCHTTHIPAAPPQSRTAEPPQRRTAVMLHRHTPKVKSTDEWKCWNFRKWNTLRGLWVIDGSTTLPPQLAAKYCLKFIDIMHVVMSVLVFAAIALFDQNVLNCFFPTPSTEIQEILTALPVGIGVFGSMFFVVFPTQRHGIGFPLSTN